MALARRCPVCGAEHAACGGPTATDAHRPVDQLITPEESAVTEKRQRYHVTSQNKRNETPTLMLLTAKEAKQYPGARLADRQPGDRPSEGVNPYEGATASDQPADEPQPDAAPETAPEEPAPDGGDEGGTQRADVSNKARRTR